MHYDTYLYGINGASANFNLATVLGPPDIPCIDVRNENDNCNDKPAAMAALRASLYRMTPRNASICGTLVSRSNQS